MWFFWYTGVVSNLFGSGQNVWQVFCSTKLIVMSRNSMLHLTLHSRQQEDARHISIPEKNHIHNILMLRWLAMWPTLSCFLFVPKATPSSWLSAVLLVMRSPMRSSRICWTPSSPTVTVDTNPPTSTGLTWTSRTWRWGVKTLSGRTVVDQHVATAERRLKI